MSRVIAPDAKAAKKELGILSIEAASEGKWGNRIQISMDTVTKRKMQLIAQSGSGYIAKTVEGSVRGSGGGRRRVQPYCHDLRQQRYL